MVGDRDVLMAKTMRRRCHRLEVVLTVRGGGVHVQIAAQIADSDEHRQRASDGRLDFPAMLAQLGLDPRHAQRLIDASSVSPATFSLVAALEEAVLVQLEAALKGAIANHDVVCLGAGEVSGPPHRGFRAALAQVGLIAAGQLDARLRRALAEHLFNCATNASISFSSPPTATMSMSPQVSQPRRRLPTGTNSTSGAWLCR